MKTKSPIQIRRELGEKIRNAREKAGLTQDQVAKLADMDTNYYARIERGVGNPSYEKLYCILQALRMDSLSIK